MDEITLGALLGSIEKWRNIVDRKGVDDRGDNCPLCEMFATNINFPLKDQCRGCPVAATTGLGNCAETPYTSLWMPLHGHRVQNPLSYSDQQVAAARVELAFLEGLLPRKKG